MDVQSALFTHPGDLGEAFFWLLPVGCALFAVGTCVLALVRGRLAVGAVSILFVSLPLLAFAFTNQFLMERSKQTEFCASCHIMEPVRASTVAGDGSLASFHVTRGAVPRGRSCYTCHSGYGFRGDVAAKFAGFGHMVHTLSGSYDLPLRMRGPFNIDACLDCHAETQRFREQPAHQVEDIQTALLSREMGCAGACHPAAHPPEALTGEVLEP